MKPDESTAAIVEDINSLGALYTLKIELTDNSKWEKHFETLSLDSHIDNQLLFTFTSKLVISGTAQAKHSEIEQFFIQDATQGGTDKKHRRSLLSIISEFFFPPSTEEKIIPESVQWSCGFSFLSNTHYKIIAVLTDGTKHHLGNIKLIPKMIEEDGNFSQELAQKIKVIESSRAIMQKNIDSNRNYLFVIGNARSGTTALLNLVNASDKICLGNERYEKFDISANGYERAEFFDSESPSLKVREQLYKKLDPKFDGARYIGDKRPGFSADWKSSLLNIPSMKILYIFRNIHGVAASYNERASNAASGTDTSWSLKRDFRAAVDDWNLEIQQGLQMAGHSDLLLVKYEDIFNSKTHMQRVFNWLGIDTHEPGVEKLIRNTIVRSKSLKEKDREMDMNTKNYIEAHADFKSYNAMIELYEQQ